MKGQTIDSLMIRFVTLTLVRDGDLPRMQACVGRIILSLVSDLSSSELDDSLFVGLNLSSTSASWKTQKIDWASLS